MKKKLLYSGSIVNSNKVLSSLVVVNDMWKRYI